MTERSVLPPAADLGARKPAPFEQFDDADVLVTGGTGSFGSRFVETVLDNANVRRLIVYSRDELKQYELQSALADNARADRLRFFLGDVRDFDRLAMAFHNVHYVIHAAAQKQIVASEYNPFECVRTNIIGAENVVRAAIHNKVKRVVALSTDKAVNPINLYGATKLASDKIFVAANNLSGDARTRFSIVRYGNVINSRGSVLPLFRRLVAESSGYLPITDERMTRFWITLDQGVEAVLSALRTMEGGEIFVPKIPSMRVVELARALAPDFEIRIIGIRPGEKLHEIMVPRESARNTLDYGGHYVVHPDVAFWDDGRITRVTQRSGAQVDDEFEYRSDNNSDWLDANDLRALLAAAL